MWRTRAIPTHARNRAVAGTLRRDAVLWFVAHTVFAGPSALPAYVDAALRARRVAAGWVMLPQFLAFLWPWYPHSSDVMIWLPPRRKLRPCSRPRFTLAAFAGVLVLPGGGRRGRACGDCAGGGAASLALAFRARTSLR
jgi:hypothetical protein